MKKAAILDRHAPKKPSSDILSFILKKNLKKSFSWNCNHLILDNLKYYFKKETKTREDFRIKTHRFLSILWSLKLSNKNALK